MAVPMAGGAHALAAGATLEQATSPVVCGVDTLSVTLGPIAGTGTVNAPLRFTNTDPRPCVIQGFPGVAYMTGDEGDQVGQAAQRDGPRLGPVTLQQGEVAFATLTMVQARTFEPSVCRPTPVGGLRVYPPNDAQWVFVPLPSGFTGCASNPPRPQLQVGSVEAGAGPS
jgi:hypothetical protein